ncbi:MAG: hypothetical protein COY38_02980 [Candidatus Aenigmarchaeota archaeon CG_4_10_14_0_8_um_filter_37_24]|nr:DUF4405 domain-containing protein [Candidatus Aenigmarchaeota archaeon]OIN88599.1 MAG: hypothetical protein AUJ50_00410 [Candidatus Aenigmarchaeota archaeon CG1_02_38_14]PIV67984.1 MAG: hypothetical protein COS07_05615 [Candidatus Aenigmarchaeota archaeon CG01_land_8_20_14_3_00_37_9]PIW41652.1 MAG: hypothetical protein COW21_00770 [Candidatus Aenigmarchaeota archaeon CG15_BIG_FIL_POST_REV_8_21_14_020_37_27]PIX50723.1 MAG: hypothetical protein COZ52_02615 [Candidatus Aenigmarchaeota archaeon 
MKKIDQNMLIDLTMSLFFLVSGLTGILLFLKIRRVFFLGWDVSRWHTYSSIALIVVVGIHLILHFTMIKSYVKGVLKKREP